LRKCCPHARQKWSRWQTVEQNLTENKNQKKIVKMRKTLSVLVLIILCSCNKVTETENEINAVQEVLNFYNGECLKSKGFEKNNGVDKHYYEIEISKSEFLNQSPDKLKSHSANIAYLFYSNLKNEKSNYDEIKVKINWVHDKLHFLKKSINLAV
jgi:hypothetical protein